MPNSSARTLPSCLSKLAVYLLYKEEMGNKPVLTRTHFIYQMWKTQFPNVYIPKVQYLNGSNSIIILLIASRTRSRRLQSNVLPCASMYRFFFLFLNSAKSIYEMHNLCAHSREVEMPRSRGEQERAYLVAKGASNPANVSHQCTKRAPSASSKIAQTKRFSLFFHRTEREKYYKHGEKAKRNPEKYLSITVDGMDQAKHNLPHFNIHTKVTKYLLQIKLKL